MAANRATLAIEQPWLDLESTGPIVSWTIGRDGSLTAKVETDEGARWLADCSLPTRAAEAMLKTAQLTSPVTCFLAPFHASAIRCTLDRLKPEQAVIAVVPSVSELAVLLRCDNFTPEIDQHRLWFVAGKGWAEQLKQLLSKEIGLAVPAQFLRFNVSEDSLIRQLIDQAQIVFTSVTAARSKQMQVMQAEVTQPVSRRLCVMTPMQFRLWQDEGYVLSHVAPADAIRIDTADPMQASPIKLARSAIDAGMLLTPNLARADLPNLIPRTIPWLTWITNDRVPAFTAAGPADALLIVDPLVQASACAAGWPRDRLHAAAWPTLSRQAISQIAELTVLADTSTLEASKELDKFSSQRVLWETIRREVAEDPNRVLLLGAAQYLKERLEQFNITADAFPFETFINELIVPAYGQAIVDTMFARNLKVQLYGEGWNQVDRFKPFVAGTVPSRKAFDRAIDASHALLHIWPTTFLHPIDALGLPVVRLNATRQKQPSPASDRPSIAEALRMVLQAL